MAANLTISIINHSNPEMLRECLRSLFAGTHTLSLEVRVVDNATDGRLVQEIQMEFPQVHWLFSTVKLGFSANHNQVLCQITSAYACILNDDSIVHDGAFDRLVEYMNAHPIVGLAGPRLLNSDGTQQDCTFRFTGLKMELIANCLLPKSLDFLKAASVDPVQFQEHNAQVDWVLGACIVIRKSALAQIGLLDSVLSPIGNGEEVDWCLRARKAGWGVSYCPGAVLTHLGGQSFTEHSKGADKTRIEFKKTSLRFTRKHFGLVQTLILRVIFVATLPWNIFMLTQTFLRRRTSRDYYLGHVQTLLAIAGVGVSRL